MKRQLQTILVMTLFLFSCSTQQCSNDDQSRKKTSSTEALQKQIQNLNPQNNMKKIKVYKLDGSKQCEEHSGIAIEKMAEELKGIQIFKSESKHDGLMRTQMCGNPTGQCHVFEIPDSDLKKAESLGFKIWKND